MRAIFADQFPSYRLDTGAPRLILAVRDEDTTKMLAPWFGQQPGPTPAAFYRRGWEKQYAVVRLDQVHPGAYRPVYAEYVQAILRMNFRWLPLWLEVGLYEFYGSTRFEGSEAFIGFTRSTCERVINPLYLSRRCLI